MTSPNKIQANRRNAQKSTGPRTPQGKARSADTAPVTNEPTELPIPFPPVPLPTPVPSKANAPIPAASQPASPPSNEPTETPTPPVAPDDVEPTRTPNPEPKTSNPPPWSQRFSSSP